MKKFPKTVFLTVEDEDDNPFFVVREDTSVLDEEQAVGIYQLVEVGRLEIKKTLVQRSKRT